MNCIYNSNIIATQPEGLDGSLTCGAGTGNFGVCFAWKLQRRREEELPHTDCIGVILGSYRDDT